MRLGVRGSKRLVGTVAIVTGAGSSGPGIGTGKATAILFAREGARVCLVDLFLERAEETQARIQDDGGEAFAVRADVTDSAGCSEVVRSVRERFGQTPNVLVNNVGVRGERKPLHLLDDTSWDAAIAANLKSVMLMSKSVLPGMIDGGGGAIVNIASVAGIVAYGTPAYGAAKAGMIMLTRDLAAMYGRYGVRVNAISPGNVHTPMVAQTMTSQVRERRRKSSPLGIEGDGWDIGWAAVFLASEEARFVTGQNLPVDGGVTQMGPYNDESWPT